MHFKDSASLKSGYAIMSLLVQGFIKCQNNEDT